MSPAGPRGDSQTGPRTQGARLLARGRQQYEERAWRDAYDALAQADEAGALEAADVELLATSAYMLGRDDEWMRGLERAHRLHVDTGDVQRAVRCAFWIGTNLALRGETGGASGWLGRAQRLLEREGQDCVERGYLLVIEWLQLIAAGDYAAAFDSASAAAAIAQRFDDADLFAFAVMDQGQLLIKDGRVKEGLAHLDEAMVAATSGELSPIATGLVYCNVIAVCQEVYEVRRAAEWTTALTRWCEQQPDMVAFTGRCLVHRAEILQLQGAWGDALEEARRAGRRFVETMSPTAGLALYREAELLRLRGEFAAAEEAYREASRTGWEPQPGLAQLRLAQGRHDSATAAIRRATGEASDPLRRAGLLAASAEIMLAVGNLDEAGAACRELAEIAAGYESELLAAMSEYACGAVELADGNPGSALPVLRHAVERWHELGARYEAARARVLIGQACRALGDEDSANLEVEAARDVFARLGAHPDLARLNTLAASAEPLNAHGLTRRELQVLRLVAAGETNKGIAAELVVSERTIDRHVSNILTKLDVSSRAAATAYAYEHELV
jgi:ATP/maltotriose-dependent transcriptional regulator MalT